MKKTLILLMTSLLFVSCAHNTATKAESNIQITKDLKGTKFANLYFSGQPSGRTIKELKDEGFAAVINLRKKNEGKYQEYWEEAAVKNEELAYYNIPFDMNRELTSAYVDSITQKVVKHRKEGKVLVHCSSGNRVAVWLGAHFKKDHDYSKDASIEVAKTLGLNNAKAEKKLRAYLDRK